MSVCCAWKKETLKSKQQNTLASLRATLYSTKVQHAVLRAGTTSKTTKNKTRILLSDQKIFCQNLR